MRSPDIRRSFGLVFGAIALLVGGLAAVAHADDAGYESITGEGSSWSGIAIDSMRANFKSLENLNVEYSRTGSSAGRTSFIKGLVTFAASDIGFQFHPEDGSEPDKPEPGSYAYIPITAGGTSFVYSLKINGQRVSNLRLSGENVAKIFTGKLTKWNDPALLADNPGLALPDRAIVPIVRADGSGSTFHFTEWMSRQYSDIWMDYCARSDRAPACGPTSFYPAISGMIAKNGDPGVAGYVSGSSAEGSIGYVSYSYAFEYGHPVAKVLNPAGYYTEPTPENVAVSLLKAEINYDENSTEYLTQKLEGLYTDTDPRSYTLSSYSYLILRTKIDGNYNEKKGRTLGKFSYYAMCQAQKDSATLGFSPLPINLVQASFQQIRKIPGVEIENIDIAKCKNPTFSPDGTNVLAANAPMPEACDKQGPTQCDTGTGGLKSKTTRSKAPSGGSSGLITGGPNPSGANATATSSQSGGSSSSSAGKAGTRGSAAAGSGGATSCDPETGLCAASANASGSASSDDLATNAANVSNSSGDQAVAAPTVLAASSGWSSSQTSTLLVVLFAIALLVAPPLAWRRFSTSDGAK